MRAPLLGDGNGGRGREGRGDVDRGGRRRRVRDLRRGRRGSPDIGVHRAGAAPRVDRRVPDVLREVRADEGPMRLRGGQGDRLPRGVAASDRPCVALLPGDMWGCHGVGGAAREASSRGRGNGRPGRIPRLHRAALRRRAGPPATRGGVARPRGRREPPRRRWKNSPRSR